MMDNEVDVTEFGRLKPGDLVRCTYRDLIYAGGAGLGFLEEGELLLVIDNNEVLIVKILHPVYGPGLVTRCYIELVK
jgi:hypothetical protein